MSTVERDLARHDRQMQVSDTYCDQWQRIVDDARADIDSGRDYAAKCDQESIQELLGADDLEFWVLVRRLRTSETIFDRNAAARELQEHCNRIVDDMVTRYADMKMAPF